MTKASRAVRVLSAVGGFVADRLHDTHPSPIGLELVRDSHRERRADALAHLGPVRDDGDESLLVDGHERRGIETRHIHRRCRGRAACESARQKTQPDHETTGYGCTADKEASAAEVFE